MVERCRKTERENDACGQTITIELWVRRNRTGARQDIMQRDRKGKIRVSEEKDASSRQGKNRVPSFCLASGSTDTDGKEEEGRRRTEVGILLRSYRGAVQRGGDPDLQSVRFLLVKLPAVRSVLPAVKLLYSQRVCKRSARGRHAALWVVLLGTACACVTGRNYRLLHDNGTWSVFLNRCQCAYEYEYEEDDAKGLERSAG